jgi:hypothetical protein
MSVRDQQRQRKWVRQWRTKLLPFSVLASYGNPNHWRNHEASMISDEAASRANARAQRDWL